MLRKTLVALLVFVSMGSIAGCIPVITDEYYEICQDVAQIKSIALYECIDDGVTINKLNELPLASISESDFAAFINDLEGIYSKTGFYITIAAQDPSFYFDKYVIKITYKNGDQEFVSNGGYQEIIKAEGPGSASHYSFDDDEWVNFLQKYFFAGVRI